MSEQAKTELSCGESNRVGPWYLLRKWQSSRLFNQDVGLPPFLEPGDRWWMSVDQLQRSLAAAAWPGYVPTPLFVPYISGSMHHPGQTTSEEQYKWRVSLDVAHFSPSEICLSVKDGFLEVGGKHEERPDEYGFIARCFTRKYRLPGEIDVTKITSSLSVDGVLTVEAPVPQTSVPAASIIPVKVEVEVAAEEKEETPKTEPESSEQIPAAAKDHGKEEEAAEVEVEEEIHDDPAQPDGATSMPQQQEETSEQKEKMEKEEVAPEKPAEESLPSVSAEVEVIESVQEPPAHHRAVESQVIPEIPDPDMSAQPEHEGPEAEEVQEILEVQEVQVTAGSTEAAEEITQPEETDVGQSPLSQIPSQLLEAHAIKQEHTE